jgi:hypothetical protein
MEPKRRRINDDYNNNNHSQHITDNSLPLDIYYSTNPQDLTYSVLTSNKQYYNKQEVLAIINKLHHMLYPTFDGDCSYIS